MTGGCSCAAGAVVRRDASNTTTATTFEQATIAADRPAPHRGGVADDTVVVVGADGIAETPRLVSRRVRRQRRRSARVLHDGASDGPTVDICNATAAGTTHASTTPAAAEAIFSCPADVGVRRTVYVDHSGVEGHDSCLFLLADALSTYAPAAMRACTAAHAASHPVTIAGVSKTYIGPRNGTLHSAGNLASVVSALAGGPGSVVWLGVRQALAPRTSQGKWCVTATLEHARV